MSKAGEKTDSTGDCNEDISLHYTSEGKIFMVSTHSTSRVLPEVHPPK
jgi:hypothetical protein